MSIQNQSHAAVKAFAFDGHPIRVIHRGEEVLFVAADICEVLGLVNPREAVSRLDDDDVQKVDLRDVSGVANDLKTIATQAADGIRPVSDGIRQRGNPIANAVTLSGFYSLVLRSDKPIARRFQKWVTKEVIPSILQTGSYTAPGATATLPGADDKTFISATDFAAASGLGAAMAPAELGRRATAYCRAFSLRTLRHGRTKQWCYPLRALRAVTAHLFAPAPAPVPGALLHA